MAEPTKVILDSSSLIALSGSCLFNILYKLKAKNNLDFLISENVKRESVDTPLSINRFELNALRIREAINKGTITVVKQTKELDNLMKSIEEAASQVFSSEGAGSLRLIHAGELESIALVKLLNAKILAIDERITRFFVENPEELGRLLETRRNEKISYDENAYSKFASLIPQMTIIRSSELIALAYEQGFLEDDLGKGKLTLKASLFALKNNGCAMSGYEIKSFVGKI
ncbi:MAG: hypothetical protein COT15_05095 [Candidatus Diapherotrites archaeon CG08_land_8_20_14_0_20_34_12]|nr:MAG: hypothetical protein COT15_05095 [Candidatus Diapherotrites archaeon CG08_land_8_20_14_0_20_34_12]